MSNLKAKNVGNSSFLCEIMGGESLKFKSSSLESFSFLSDIAGEIGADPFLSERLALYGEAALNLCFNEPSRLPTSLSYIFVADTDPKLLAYDRAETLARLSSIGKEMGAKVQIADKTDETKLTYISSREGWNQSKFEISIGWSARLSLGQCEISRIWVQDSRNGAVARNFRSLRLPDSELAVFAVLFAIAHPSADRVYDLALAYTHFKDNWANPLMKGGFVWQSMNLPRPIASYSDDRFGVLKQRDFDLRLASGIRGGVAPRVNHILPTAIEAIKPFLSLTSEEAEYLEKFDRGEYDPALLFGKYPDALESALKVPIPTIGWKGSENE